MEYTNRISPTNIQGQFGTYGSSADVQTIWGGAYWDLSLPADLADITAGNYKKAKLYKYYVDPTQTPPSDSLITAAPLLCCYSLDIFAAQLTNFGGRYLYDDSVEIAFGSYGNGPRCWWWGATFDGTIVDLQALQTREPIFGYEGPPMPLDIWLRPGMVIGSTPANQTLVVSFLLRVMPFASFGKDRICIPSPNSAPPFMPYGASKGTHIFSAHANSKLPGKQPYAVERIFRTKALNVELVPGPTPAYDARVLGGPWMAQAFCGKVAAEADQCITVGIIEDMPQNTTPAIASLAQLDLQGPNSAIELATKRPCEGARVTLYGETAHTMTELFFHYP